MYKFQQNICNLLSDTWKFMYSQFKSQIISTDKKLCYRRRTARRDVSVNILPTAT